MPRTFARPLLENELQIASEFEFESGFEIEVEYFAIFRALAKKNGEALTVKETPLPALYESLKARYGFPLEQASVHVAVNDSYAAWDTVLRAGDRVVFIPPVAGG